MDALSEYPQSFEEYVGQDEIKRRLKIYIDWAIKEDKSLPHVLLTTTPGQGKTALARVIAAEIGDPITLLDITAVRSTDQLLSFMRRFQGGILFIDEIHRGTKQQLESLLTLLEESYIPTPGGGRFQVKWFTCIAATTNPEKLPEALVERFTLRPEFAPYTDEEATAIIRQMAGRADLDMPAEIAKGLGRAAAGTPRVARHLVTAYRALINTRPEATVTDVLDLVGIDKDGLSKAHYEYLTTLDKLDGRAGEASLKGILRMAPETLRDTERVLFRQGLIGYSPKGRYLTSDGFAKVGGLTPAMPSGPIRRKRKEAAA